MANWTEATEAKWPVLTPLSLAAESGVAHVRVRVGVGGLFLPIGQSRAGEVE